MIVDLAAQYAKRFQIVVAFSDRHEFKRSPCPVKSKKILLEITGTEEAEAAVVPELLVDISMKPLMMVVWTGVILIIAGTALAFQRRMAEKPG